MRRTGIVFLALLLLFTCLPLGGRAAEPMRIWGEGVTGSYEEVLSLPIRLVNNRGLMGASIELTYDDSVFAPLRVTRGEVWSGGLLDHDLESAAGTLQIVWSGSEGCYADGVLVTVDFAVKGEAYGTYPVDIRCNSDHTFNESYERLQLPCTGATLTLTKETTEPLLYSGSYSAVMGEAVDISLRIAHNTGLARGTVSLSYDDGVLQFAEVLDGLAEGSTVESGKGTLRIAMNAVAEGKGDGTLFRVRFRVRACEAGTYPLLWTYDGGVTCHPAQLSVLPGCGRIYGGQIQQTEDSIRVPVCIAANPGLMGLKLRITYDTSLLKPDSVLRSSLFSDGMFSYNTDEEGALLLVWSGTEDMREDGELFLLDFSLLRDMEQDTVIGLSYSQADTFNSAWEDVGLYCEEITVPHSTQQSSCHGGTDCPGYGLEDMPPADHWSHSGIDFVLEQGLMIGVSDTKFAPKKTFTRAMMVTVLYRMENCPQVTSDSPFTDVAQGAWYADAVTWASEAGVAEGYGNGTFKPEAPVTREQIAVMFCRYAKLTRNYQEAEGSHLEGFPDVGDVSSWAKEELNWAVDVGLITGVGTREGNFLLPLNHASREQVAVILMRFLST